MKKLGQKLRALREKAGLSQRRVAFLSGLSNTYIGHVEKGYATPTYITTRILEAAVKAEPGVLTSMLPEDRRKAS